MVNYALAHNRKGTKTKRYFSKGSLYVYITLLTCKGKTSGNFPKYDSLHYKLIVYHILLAKGPFQ